MKKKTYVKPVLNSEEFVPQEYIAACGDSGIVYNFECNAGPKDGGDVYLETNGVPGLQKKRKNGISKDRSLGGYHPCGEKHKAESTDDFLNGYLVYEKGSIWHSTEVVENVIVWRGPYGDNVHCTDKLDIKDWETLKS